MMVAACFFLPAGKGTANKTRFNLYDVLWPMGLAAVTFLMIKITVYFQTSNSQLICAVVYGIPAIICFGFIKRPIRFALGFAVLFFFVESFVGTQSNSLILQVRDFYGVNRVNIYKKRFHSLVNGNITHGLQLFYPQPNTEPLGYYNRLGPLGDLACAFDDSKPNRHIAAIGLGTGSIASYATAGQRITFYEIDPLVIRIASDPKLFTYLDQCPAKLNIIEGDARLQLANAPDGEFDTVVVDAFSSDSIPMHLLTRQALELYWRKLKPDGLLVFHISNRYFNLETALAAFAEKSNMVCLIKSDLKVSKDEEKNGKFPSRYLVMAHNVNDLGELSKNSTWRPAAIINGFQEWTDDYSNIMSVLNW
jgi:SAM-dependent methyltransferase